MPPNNLSGFRKALSVAETPEKAADAFSNLTRELLHLSYYDEAKNAANNALAAALEVGSILQEARALYYLGRISFYRSEYQEALIYYLRSLTLFEIIGDKGRIAITLGNIGSVYRSLSDYASAVEYYHKALIIDEELQNWQGIANHTGNIGNVYLLLSDYPKALMYYHRSLALTEDLGNMSGVATHTCNLGNLYLYLHDYSNALEYYHKALAIQQKLGDKLSEAIYTGNIAGVYFHLKEYQKSLEYYHRALIMYEALGNKSGIAEMNGNIGTIYKQVVDYPQALRYHYKALLVNEEIGNKRGIATSTSGLGVVFTEKEFEGYDPIKAEQYLLRAVAIYQELGTKNELYTNYQLLSELYSETGDWAKAYTYHKLFHDLEKEVQSEEAKKQAEQLDYERKTAEHERQTAIERAKHEATEQLLHNVLPPSVAAKMLGGATLIAEKLGNVSVLFADIVGFTTLSQSITPEQLVEGLDLIFSEFDELAEKHGLEKIKTIGDAYMVVSGAPIPRTDHAQAIAQMAIEMVDALKKFEAIATGAPIEIRIGIHTGEAVAGVIGKKKFAYDLWGDAVNTASRMESHGVPGKIHCSEEFARELARRTPTQTLPQREGFQDSRPLSARFPLEEGFQDSSPLSAPFPLEEGFQDSSPLSAPFPLGEGRDGVLIARGEIDIRGKGKMKTYFLETVSSVSSQDSFGEVSSI